MKTRHATRQHRGGILMLTAGLMAAMALQGCYESTTDVDANQAAGLVDGLTMEEVNSKIQLSDDQAAALAPLLDSWRQQRASGDRHDLAALRMMADVSDVLDRDQMLGLLALMQEKKQAAVQERRNRRHQQGGPGAMRDRGRQPGEAGGPARPAGPGMRRGKRGGGPGAGLLKELNLSEEQQVAVKAARQEMHTATKALFEQFRAGTITREELHAAMQPLHEQMWTTIEGILDANQLAQLNDRRNTRALKRLDHALEKLQTNGGEKLALIARILEMDDEQMAAATTLHNDGTAALAAIIESLRSGQTTADEATQAARDLRKQSRDDFRSLLNAGQQEIFDALTTLRHRRQGRGPRH